MAEKRDRTPADALAASAHWKEVVAPFRGAERKRSVIQLSVTVLCFFGLWAAMYLSLRVHYGLTLLLAFPTGGFLMRLFMIQHDCGHGSYFESRRARDLVGFFIGVLTLTPYQYWRRTHAYHHAHSGNLDLRGFGDIDTLTVNEYLSRSSLGRLAYRVYRNPIVLLGIGPSFHFLVKHRFPWDVPRSWKQAWSSVWWTNLCLAAIWIAMAFTIGLRDFLLVQTPITLLTCALGVWLFYVQHQFEDTYWHRHEDWNYVDAALHGSTHLVLPRPLQWITASIGLHHVHHLNPQIPNYRLQDCLDSSPDLQQATRITLLDGWRLLGLSLWDENANRLIGFRELRRTARA
ncbi:MAG TPA: fatty acid desaturase [Longimicrobiales bacterium]|nr:fatty acid desaturase [Longimicrobiales bacterium]